VGIFVFLTLIIMIVFGRPPLPMQLWSKGAGLLRAPLRFGFFCSSEKAEQKRAKPFTSLARTIMEVDVFD